MFRRLFFIVFIFSLGIIGGWFGRYFYVHNIKMKTGTQMIASSNPTLREKTSYPLISPLLACTLSENKPARELLSLKDIIQKMINSKKTQDNVANASVYFRDLTTGSWTGIDENQQYSPASLLKIPIMIAYFRKAESDPSVLQEQIQYQGALPQDIPQLIKPAHTLEQGKFYTVDELIRRTIVESDNLAEEVLLSHLDTNYIQEVFTDLSLNPNAFIENSDTMSAKSFSLFFRLLYNATYLNQEMSEKALEFLTQSDFTKGIIAGLPNQVKVAHKFGERTYVSPVTGTLIVRQLHECAIVYLPNDPYLLCVMTKGMDYEKLGDLIANISTAVYNAVVHNPKVVKTNNNNQ